MKRKGSNKLLSQIGLKRYLKARKRRAHENQRRCGFRRFLRLLKANSKLTGHGFHPPSYQRAKFFAKLGEKPKYDERIEFLKSKYQDFSEIPIPSYQTGYLLVPEIFSLSEVESYGESMDFLKRLFHVLLKQSHSVIVIDYKRCQVLDVDASAFMDIILAGFINYYNKCSRKGHNCKMDEIKPINIDNDEVKKVLLSIGAFKNLTGFELEPQNDIIPFALRIGDSKTDPHGRLKEIHETEIVDYVIDCLNKMGRTLTAEAESHLSKVVGEVMANAEEHSNFRYRFAIGYFKKSQFENNALGVFKLSIFNFGQTIYESFKREENGDLEVVHQMRKLSEHFTKKGFFRKAAYEEQTLWTLYALQEGVTSTKNWKRGKGTIRFIDRFFRLKGENEYDNYSKLILNSGNTQIIFDGTYPLIEVRKGEQIYQMMTFNDSGDIKEKPNKKFVTFASQYFPGTLISAKINIKMNNVENQ